jgi:hypothetical protein
MLAIRGVVRPAGLLDSMALSARSEPGAMNRRGFLGAIGAAAASVPLRLAGAAPALSRTVGSAAEVQRYMRRYHPKFSGAAIVQRNLIATDTLTVTADGRRLVTFTAKGSFGIDRL